MSKIPLILAPAFHGVNDRAAKSRLACPGARVRLPRQGTRIAFFFFAHLRKLDRLTHRWWMSRNNERSNTSPAAAVQRADGAADLRIFGYVATLGAAWLALSVARKPATPLERKITPQKKAGPMPLRVGGQAASVASYPVVYLPLAVFIAGRLRAQGVDAASA